MGIDLQLVLDIFIKSVEKSDMLIAHNFIFDSNVIAAEFERVDN